MTAEPAMAVIAKVPQEQKVRYTVKPQGGMLVSCQALGGQLKALGDFFKETARADGLKVHTLINGIRTNENGEIEFEIVIAMEAPK